MPIERPSLILISCVRRKQPRLSLAKDLYTSAWFVAARAYVERQHLPWAILSARYGLLDPNDEIDTYNETLLGKPIAQRQAWADQVYTAITERYPLTTHPRIELLAGNAYAEFLLLQLITAGYTVTRPLEHLGIGRQQQWLNNQLASPMTQGAGI